MFITSRLAVLVCTSPLLNAFEVMGEVQFTET